MNKRITKQQHKELTKMSKNSSASSKHGMSQELDLVEETQVPQSIPQKAQSQKLLKKRLSSQISDDYTTSPSVHDSIKKVNISSPQKLFLVEKPLIYNRYRVVRRLGPSRGASKQVYLVQDIKMENRFLVLKFFMKSERWMFYKERNNNAIIIHSNTQHQVTMIGQVEYQQDMPESYLAGQKFTEYALLIFEYHPNETVLDVIMKAAQINHALSAELEQFIQFSVALAMFELYKKCGLSHLDAKCDNFVFNKYNKIMQIDFGSAHKVNEAPIKGFPIGTLQYMPPEYLIKEPTSNEKFDTFGFGVMCFNIHYRKVPFAFAHPDDKNYKLIDQDDFEQFFNKFSGSQIRDINFEKIVQTCLTKASQRLRYEQIISHEYFNQIRQQGLTLSDPAKRELAFLQSIKLLK
eukprot:403364165